MYQPNFPNISLNIGLYPVVDSLSWIEHLLKIGVRIIQLRIKNKSNNEVEPDIVSAIKLGFAYKAQLFINDYWCLAIKHQAWGVHLGQEDIKKADLKAISKAGLRLGISTHNSMEVETALNIKPSYIALGNIFPTRTKQMPYPPQGLKGLESHIKYLKNYPTVAIGGINLDNILDVLATGVRGIAVVSAITHAHNWKLSTMQLLKLVGIGVGINQ